MSGTQAALIGASDGIKPTGLINGSSLLYVYNGPQNANALGTLYGCATLAYTGAVTSNVYKTVLSLSGKGAITFLAISPVDTVSGTHSIRVTLDGVVIFNATSGTTTSINNCMQIIGTICPIGFYNGNPDAYTIIPEPLCFNTSLLIEYASSRTTGLDTAKVAYRYIPR